MLKDTLISNHKALKPKMAFVDEVMNLVDGSTWDGIDYEPLLDLVHKKNSYIHCISSNVRITFKWRH